MSRAIVGRLLAEAEDNIVVALELDPAALSWADEHAAGSRVLPVVGDASEEAVAERAA
jgi:hypothetical protein